MSINLGALLKKKFPDCMNVDVISEINYLDTGVSSLNYVLSGLPYSGGLPLSGKITICYGVEGASKTTLAINVIAEAQKRDYDVVYIDTECSVTTQRLRSMGVDKDKMYYLTPNNMEEVFTILETVCNEKIKEQDDKPMLIVWDSIGSSVTEEECSRTMSAVEVASSAKVLTRNLKKMIPLFHKLPHTGCLFISQSRQNMNLYGDAIKMTGGQQLLHSGTIIVRVGKQKAGVDGQICVFSTIKNKCFNPFQKTEIMLDYNRGFTKEAKITSFCDMLKTIGLLVQSGSYCGYSDKLKQIILDNKFNEKDGEVLFDPNKNFYLKDMIKRLEDDDNFYESVLKASEEFIQKNIIFVTEKCKDGNISDNETEEYTKITTKKSTTSDPADEMFESMEKLENK